MARASHAGYGPVPPSSAPELPGGRVRNVAEATLRELFLAWGLDAARAGTREWNPLGDRIAAGSRVVIKPNWVLHVNRSGHGLDCLITHQSLIEAVLEYVCLTRPASVAIGDAPIQGCDLKRLWEACGIEAMAARFRERGLDLKIADFRRTVLFGATLGSVRAEGVRDMSHYVLFDLGKESLLEPLAPDAERFRVTMYNPDLLSRTHAPGRHQYLIAREVIDADAVINLPKLKSHKKAGITGALKNPVGINGNKEFLPHHRKGGSATGGDCYEGGSWLKAAAEDLLDHANRLPNGRVQALLEQAGGIVNRCAAKLSEDGDDNLEGAWYGNDTVWRTSLDLQRVLAYGCADGKLSPAPQRRVIHITDAIVGGDGDGPLAPDPVESGFLTGAANPAAAEWVHAILMGFDPRRVPIVREAFGRFRYPLAEFSGADVRVRTMDEERPAETLANSSRNFRPSRGWVGHCELETTNDRVGEQPVVA